MGLIFISIFIIIIIKLIENANKYKEQYNNEKEKYNQQINQLNYNMIYKPKDNIITKTELKFYKILLEIAKELDLILFSQVSLYNIIETKFNNQSAFNKIRSKTIDFVLVDKDTCKIKIAIELDDYTHILYDRQKRDSFINKLFKDLNINLLRFEVQQQYDKEKIINKIKECL